MCLDLTLDPSFKVKRGQPNLKILIASGYCFYRFAMFGDTPPALNKATGISIVKTVIMCLSANTATKE